QKLRHVNIAKVFDFGREGSDFVYVSEHLPGETLAAWVRGHGPMRADAALRVAEQIVSVLSSASFHKLPYPCIQPSDVMIVPGDSEAFEVPKTIAKLACPDATSRSRSTPKGLGRVGGDDSAIPAENRTSTRVRRQVRHSVQDNTCAATRGSVYAIVANRIAGC